jgi:hypothetical protein
MNEIVIKNTKRTILASVLLMFIATGCDRSVDGLSEPGFTTNPEVFIDTFSPGLNYLPYEGSRAEAFTVDNQTYFGVRGASMRFDVPNFGDPDGAFAGAIFRDENGGRNLSSYNALTFYAKATKASTLNNIGFGQDFFENRYEVSLNDLRLTTNWRRYVIPIPDPSLLTQHRGLLWYADGPEDGDGYSFWLDEVKYENIEGLAQPRPAIMNGEQSTQTVFVGAGTNVTGLIFTANQPNGQDVTVGAAPAYFNFSSSNTSVATVNEQGQVSVVGEGSAEITATVAGINANGALIITSLGAFSPAPPPTEDPSDVISIFSDVYENVPVDFYNGFYAPFQTTTSNDFEINGNNILGYENFNFVGIEFNQNVPTIDGSEMTHLRMDIFFPDPIPANSALGIRIVNDLAGSNVATRTLITPPANPASPQPDDLVSGEWIRVDFDITGLTDRSQLGQIILDSDDGPGLQGSTFYVDNIYLRR